MVHLDVYGEKSDLKFLVKSNINYKNKREKREYKRENWAIVKPIEKKKMIVGALSSSF